MAVLIVYLGIVLAVGPPDRSIFIYDPNTQTNHVMNKGVGI